MIGERQKSLLRAERAKYNLVHPTLGTITQERAVEIWAQRDVENNVYPTSDEREIIMHLWDQMPGSSCFMDAFFIFRNQEPL